MTGHERGAGAGVTPPTAGTREREAAARRRRRTRYLLLSLPVVVLVVIVAVKLIGLSIVNQVALDRFAVGAYGASAEQSSSLLDGNYVERYIPWFNRGNAYAAQQKYTDAIDDLEKALDFAPASKKCDVRVNLSLSWELLGDIYMAGGYYQGAVQLYQAAQAVIEEGGDACRPPDAAGEQLQAAEPRLLAKIDEAQQQQSAAADPGGQDGAGGQQDQLDQLGQNEQQGAQENADGEGADRGEDNGQPAGVEKPW